MEKTIDTCLEEVSQVLLSFLEEQGGYSNGYYTYANGVVSAFDKEPKALEWLTPKAKEELTPKGIEVRGKELYKKIQNVLKQHGLNSVLIRYRDENYGAMEVEIVHIQETKKNLPLYRMK